MKDVYQESIPKLDTLHQTINKLTHDYELPLMTVLLELKDQNE